MIRNFLVQQSKLLEFTSLSTLNSYNFSDFIIKKGYLIPKPPKRAQSPFNLYLSNKMASDKSLKMADVAKLYKDSSVDKDLKSKVEKQSKELREAHEVEVQLYEEKYTLPKKQLSLYNIYTMERFKESNHTQVKDAIREFSQDFKSLTKSEINGYEKILKKHNEESLKYRNQFDKKFKIPVITKRQAKTIFKESHPKLTTVDQVDAAFDKLSDKQKEKYADLAEEDHENQIQNFNKFLKDKKISLTKYKKLEEKYLKQQEIKKVAKKTK